MVLGPKDTPRPIAQHEEEFRPAEQEKEFHVRPERKGPPKQFPREKMVKEKKPLSTETE